MTIYYALFGLIAGVIAGNLCPYSMPPEYGRLLAVAVMAGMDAVLGGVRSAMENKYDIMVFLSGFFVNGIMGALLCYFGAMLGIDMYMVAILIFGMRIFQNIGVIRREYMGR